MDGLDKTVMVPLPSDLTYTIIEIRQRISNGIDLLFICVYKLNINKNYFNIKISD